MKETEYRILWRNYPYGIGFTAVDYNNNAYNNNDTKKRNSVFTLENEVGHGALFVLHGRMLQYVAAVFLFE